jgi:hypothetical protein
MGQLLHYQFRGLLSVHSCYNLQTRRIALCDPFHRRLQRLRCLHRCSDCYRVERSSSRAGLSSRCGPAPFTAHCNRLFTAIITLAAAFLLSLESEKENDRENSQPFLSATTKILSRRLTAPQVGRLRLGSFAWSLRVFLVLVGACFPGKRKIWGVSPCHILLLSPPAEERDEYPKGNYEHGKRNQEPKGAVSSGRSGRGGGCIRCSDSSRRVGGCGRCSSGYVRCTGRLRRVAGSHSRCDRGCNRCRRDAPKTFRASRWGSSVRRRFVPNGAGSRRRGSRSNGRCDGHLRRWCG